MERNWHPVHNAVDAISMAVHRYTSLRPPRTHPHQQNKVFEFALQGAITVTLVTANYGRAPETPKYLYKILPSSAPPPTPLPSALPLSPLDSTDGYIHLSTAAQTPATANRFFANETTLYILKVEYTRVAADVKWEEAGSGIFAHLYNGGKLGIHEIVDVKQWEKGDQDWKTSLDGVAWLE
ncbi:hypothetical protein BS47DRAFT_303203 [Hydnum rufescens UP504]|uniref:Uncharacterized protein n=1 Tax=Hydnum rufescens UP504 TaxID=1448309 RepID=A0A9P6E107_9AGAM|nr:hypothetical protein BS47DRAFT_303203 [Hydnum rufescens UP504]